MSFQAIWAGTTEKDLTVFNLQAVFLCNLFADTRTDKLAGNVQYCAALCADKMRMRSCISVKALLTIYNTDADDDSITFKLRNVAVNRAKTQIGILWLQLLINPFRRGVYFCASNGGKDCFTLAAEVLSLFH